MKQIKRVQSGNIDIYLKRSSDATLDNEIASFGGDEDYFMSAFAINISSEFPDRQPTNWYASPTTHNIEIEHYHISERFILIDLERPKKRVKKYRRCGFSTKKW